jgi:hypothetical protein
LSQHAYWSVTWPLLGLDFAAHTSIRLALHAAASVAVHGIARKAGLENRRSLYVGLVFAASPVSFTPVVWASGIQELVAGSLALLAVLCWLSRGARMVVAAGACLGGSILAKESGLLLPVLFLFHTGIMARTMERRELRWRITMGVAGLLLAVGEARLVADQFATGQADPYRLGGLVTVLGNLGMYGWWLLTPGPAFAGQATWTMAAWGLCAWLLWAGWSIVAFSRNNRVPAAALVLSCASLAPVLPLFSQARPYMGYTAVAGVAIVLGSLVRESWLRRWFVPVLMVVAAIVWGQGTMRARMAAADGGGTPADPIVRAALLARETIAAAATGTGVGVVVFQQPLRPAALALSDRLGAGQVRATPRHESLMGSVGLALALHDQDAKWLSSLAGVPAEMRVLAEIGTHLEDWGPCPEALVRASIVDIYVGFHGRAHAQLDRAMDLGVDPRNLGFDPVDEDMERTYLTGTRAARQRAWLLERVTSGDLTMAEYQRARRGLDRLMIALAAERER